MNTKFKVCGLLFGLWALLGTTACTSIGPRYQVAVGNYTGQPIYRIRVTENGIARFSTDHIPPTKALGSKPSKIAPPQQLELFWIDAAGKSQRQEISIDPATVASDFRGHLWMEIMPAEKVKFYVITAPPDEASDVPWTRPEDWEGAPTIPGLDMN